MWEFRSQQTSRDLEILNLFFIDEKVITVFQLAEYLQCDVKTARTRILEVNNNFSFPKIIYDYETDSVKAGYDPSFSPFIIYKEFYAKNLEFQVLEYLFIKAGHTNYKLRDIFSISDSTLIRIVNNLNSNLKKWDIKIESKTYEIIGDELSITKFFTQYFLEKTMTNHFDDFDMFQKTIFSVFLDILEESNQIELRPYFNRFQWYTFVSLIRFSKGYRIQNTQNFDEKLLTKRISVLQSKDLKQLESIFGVALSSAEVVNDIFYLYFNPVILKKFNKFTYDFKTIKVLTNDIIREFTLKKNDALVSKLTQVLYENINQYFAQSYFLFDRPAYEINKIESLFPDSIQTLRFLISSVILTNTGMENAALLNYSILFVINVFPEFYQAMSAYESKLEINCFFVANREQREYGISNLINNYSSLANFNLQDNTSLPSINSKNELWFTDVPALADKHVLVINLKLLPTQNDVILDFLKAKRDENSLQFI